MGPVCLAYKQNSATDTQKHCDLFKVGNASEPAVSNVAEHLSCIRRQLCPARAVSTSFRSRELFARPSQHEKHVFTWACELTSLKNAEGFGLFWLYRRCRAQQQWMNRIHLNICARTNLGLALDTTSNTTVSFGVRAYKIKTVGKGLLKSSQRQNSADTTKLQGVAAAHVASDVMQLSENSRKMHQLPTWARKQEILRPNL